MPDTAGIHVEVSICSPVDWEIETEMQRAWTLTCGLVVLLSCVWEVLSVHQPSSASL